MLYVNARAIIERDCEEAKEILLQVRDKPGEPQRLELPGGRLEEYESFIAGLIREVYEETGLTVTSIIGGLNREVRHTPISEVEFFVPFCVYQTLKGPVDSLGIFLRCQAEGQLVPKGDNTFGHRWLGVDQLISAIKERPDQFDWLSRGALEYYCGIIENGDN